MKKGLTYKYYAGLLKKALFIILIFAVFLSFLIIFDRALWRIYLIILGTIIIILLPFMLVIFRKLLKTIKAYKGQMFDGRIVKLEGLVFFSLHPTYKALVKVNINGQTMELETAPVFKTFSKDLVGKEVQIGVNKKKTEAFIYMVY